MLQVQLTNMYNNEYTAQISPAVKVCSNHTPKSRSLVNNINLIFDFQPLPDLGAFTIFYKWNGSRNITSGHGLNRYTYMLYAVYNQKNCFLGGGSQEGAIAPIILPTLRMDYV